MKKLNIVIALIGLLAAMYLVSLSFSGLYARPIQDDLQWIKYAQTEGLLRSVGGWYLRYNGRYFAHFLGGLLAHLPGVMVRVPWLVPATILLLFGANWFLLKETGKLLGFEIEKIELIAYAITITFLEIIASPSVKHSLFWIQGIVAISLPVICFICLGGLVMKIFRGNHSRKTVMIIAFLIVVNTGCYETAGIYQLLGFGLLAVVSIIAPGLKVDPSLKSILIKNRNAIFIFMTVSLISFAVVFAAPGNQVRVDHHINPSEIHRSTISVGRSFVIVFESAYKWILPVIFIPAVLSFIIGLYLGLKRSVKIREAKFLQVFIISNVWLLLVVFSTIAVSSYVFGSSGAPPRSYTMVSILLVVAAFLTGTGCGATYTVNKSSLAVFIFNPLFSAILIFFLLLHCKIAVSQALRAPAWHRSMLEVQRILEENQDRNLERPLKLPHVPHHIFLRGHELTEDPDVLPNQYLSRFYNISPGVI